MEKVKKEKSLKIDCYKKDWAIEFSEILGIEYKPIYQKIISLAMVTALYRIADSFEPDIRNLILKRFDALHQKRNKKKRKRRVWTDSERQEDYSNRDHWKGIVV